MNKQDRILADVPHPTPYTPTSIVDPDIIATLEELLRDARAGRIYSLAVAAETFGRTLVTGTITEHARPYVLLGALSHLATEMLTVAKSRWEK